MSEQEAATFRPFVFTVIEDDGVNVTIEISQEDYQDLAAGIDEEATMKPGRYKMKRGGFLARHSEVKLEKRSESDTAPCSIDLFSQSRRARYPSLN